MPREYKDVKMSYRSTEMVDTYDTKRFLGSPLKQRLNRQFLTAIKGILNGIKTRGYQINSLLDIPCGTGRIFPTLLAGGIKLGSSDNSVGNVVRFLKRWYKTTKKGVDYASRYYYRTGPNTRVFRCTNRIF